MVASPVLAISAKRTSAPKNAVMGNMAMMTETGTVLMLVTMVLLFAILRRRR